MAADGILVDDVHTLAAGSFASARPRSDDRRWEQKLEADDRLLALGALSAGVAHHVSSPLAIALSNTQFALDELKAHAVGAEVVAALGDVLAAVKRVGEIVNDLRAYATAESRGLAPLDVNRAVTRALKLTQPELELVATVQTSLGELPRIATDEQRLGQALVDVVLHAAGEMDRRHRTQNTVHVATRHDGAEVVIEVGHHGPLGSGGGEPGLAVCHAIVKSLGGTLEVGARGLVRLRLPAR